MAEARVTPSPPQQSERDWSPELEVTVIVPTPVNPRYTIRADATGRPQVWNCPPMMPGEEIELAAAMTGLEKPHG